MGRTISMFAPAVPIFNNAIISLAAIVIVVQTNLIGNLIRSNNIFLIKEKASVTSVQLPLTGEDGDNIKL